MILLLSGTTITWAHHALLERDKKTLVTGPRPDHPAWPAASPLCQAIEYSDAPFKFVGGGVYPSTFFLATGFHGFHVIVGTCFLIVCWFRARAGHFTPERHFGFEAAAWYWHFVDVVWLFLFTCIYWWGASADRRRRTERRVAQPAPSLLHVALACRCPRCGQGRLFRNLLDVRDRCEVCGLDLRAHDAGDGAAVGVILVLGAIVVGAGVLGGVPLRAAALGACGVVAGGDDAARGADDAAGEGGAGGAAVPPSGDRDGAVTGGCAGCCGPAS